MEKSRKDHRMISHTDEIEMIPTKVIELSALMDAEPDRLRGLLREPADCLRRGGLVAFPTETVYGLGADALNETAAKRIYAAKGRPSDNPLIVHIADIEDMSRLAHVNETALTLAHAFWPGPLTIILPKKEIVPYGVTGGLETVALRMPSHPAALALIRESGTYVAAPSANSSGRPSPTTAAHVMEDMNGRIEYIIDGGPVGIGIESTIVDVTGAVPTILRPGFITKRMLEQIVGTVLIDSALEKPMDGFRPKAPGMKYTHYAPKGELTLVEKRGESALEEDVTGRQEDMEEETAEKEGSRQKTIEEITEKAEESACGQEVIDRICELAQEKRKAGFRVGIMASEETFSSYEGRADVVLCVGARNKRDTVAAGLYAALREFDEKEVDYIYAESFRGDGLSYAIMNRLLKAAGQRVVYVD